MARTLYKWDTETEGLVRKYHSEGLSAQQIALRMPPDDNGTTVSRSAVGGKMSRLGLSELDPMLARQRMSDSVSAVMSTRPAKVHQLPAHVVTIIAPVSDPSFVDTARHAIRVMPPLAINGEAANVMTLTDKMCRYPIGDPSLPGFSFCGRTKHLGAYCVHHAKICYDSASVRKQQIEQAKRMREAKVKRA